MRRFLLTLTFVLFSVFASGGAWAREGRPSIVRHSTQGPGEPGYCESVKVGKSVLLMATGSGQDAYEAFKASRAVGLSCISEAFKLTDYKVFVRTLVIQPWDNHPGQFVSTIRMTFSLP